MTKRKLTASIVLLSLSLFVVGAHVVSAQAGTAPSSPVNPTIQNPLGSSNNTVSQLLSTIINTVLLPIGAIVAVMAFIWAGFLFVTAQGDPGKLKTAKAALLYTVIGTAILLGSVALAAVIKNTITAIGQS